MLTPKYSRRGFFSLAGLTGSAALLTACAPRVVTEVVRETQIVEQTRVVIQTQLVEATPAPSVTIPQGPPAMVALINTYLAAWSEPDAQERMRLLENVWQEDGTYTDPTAHLANRAELDSGIGQFLASYPGAVLVLSGKAEAYNEHLMFPWVINFADGTNLPGRDYAELSSSGKLVKVIGFF